MGFGSSAKTPTISKPIVRTQSDVAQESRDDYARRNKARRQTLLSGDGSSQGSGTVATGKTLLGQ